jgi:hypothetical protein
VPEPDAPDAHGGDWQGLFAEFVCHALWAPGWLVAGHLHKGLFPVGRDPILPERLPPGNLLEGGLAPWGIEFFEPIEASSTVTHHLTGLRDAAELLRQLQDIHLRLDDLRFRGQRPRSFR